MPQVSLTNPAASWGTMYAAPCYLPMFTNFMRHVYACVSESILEFRGPSDTQPPVSCAV